MAYYFLGESFETFVPWKQVVACSENVKKRIIDEGKKRGIGPFDVNIFLKLDLGSTFLFLKIDL